MESEGIWTTERGGDGGNRHGCCKSVEKCEKGNERELQVKRTNK